MADFNVAKNNAASAINDGFQLRTAPPVRVTAQYAENVGERTAPNLREYASIADPIRTSTLKIISDDYAIRESTLSSDTQGKEEPGQYTTPSQSNELHMYPFGGIGAQEPHTFAGVELVARENKQKAGSARTAFTDQKNAGVKDGGSGRFKLLLQDKDFTWSASHTGEAYKGWQGPLNQLLTNLNSSIKGVGSLIGSMGNAIDAFSNGEGAVASAKGALVEMSNQAPPYVRFDQSLTYANSANRRIAFAFELAIPPKFADASKMGEIVTLLEKFSCAESKGMQDFAPPALGDIKILMPDGGPKGGLNFCALKDIKTTILGPGKGGYPAKIDVMLDFEHLPPVFADNGGWHPNGGGMPNEAKADVNGSTSTSTPPAGPVTH